MNYFDKLMELAEEVETKEAYNGYFYKVEDIITIIVIGLLCNLKNASEIYQWSKSENIQKILTEHFRMEKFCCYAQFMNILGNVKADSLDKIFIEWCNYIVNNQTKDKTIAIDGKTICSTVNMSCYENPLHIVSAYISEYGLTIGQVAVESKSNEIPATQRLLQLINIEGAVVVADALNCQRETVKIIIENKGDYLLAVKRNQKDLYDNIKFYFETQKGSMVPYSITEKGHGRIETRTAFVCHEIEWYKNKAKWLNLHCFGAVKRECETKGKKSMEIRYYISSRKLTPEEMLKHSRNEWGIESLHWILDVVFDEDRTTLMEKDAQRVLNTLRKSSINLLKLYKNSFSPKSSLVSIMRNNLFNPNYLPTFLQCFSKLI